MIRWSCHLEPERALNLALPVGNRAAGCWLLLLVVNLGVLSVDFITRTEVYGVELGCFTGPA